MHVPRSVQREAQFRVPPSHDFGWDFRRLMIGSRALGWGGTAIIILFSNNLLVLPFWEIGYNGIGFRLFVCVLRDLAVQSPILGQVIRIGSVIEPVRASVQWFNRFITVEPPVQKYWTVELNRPPIL